LEEEIAKMEASIHKLNKDRDEEHEVYQAASKDLEDTIAAVEEAIDVMKDAKSEVALVQLTQLNPKVRRALAYAQMFAPEERRDEVTALLQAPTGDKAKHVKVYKFKGGNVIELLKQLKGKFEQDLLEVEKAETNAVNAFELATKALGNKQTAAESSLDKKEDSLAAAKAALAAAEADLKDVKEDLAADSETLAETHKECAIKTSEWEERSETRAKEIEAIAMAVKILSEVGGVRTEAPDNPVPPPSPLEFTQLSSESHSSKSRPRIPKR
jgi:predicted S18 family serine protease